MRFLALVLLASALGAEEAPVFFREPDRQGKKRIEEALAELRTKTRANRRAARTDLERLGPWATERLAGLLDARAGKEIVRLNAAIVITRLRDPHGLAAIRKGLDAQPVVARTCCFALGYFGLVDDGPRLAAYLDRRGLKEKEKAAALLACARIAGTKWPGELVDPERPEKRRALARRLLARSRTKLPKDEREAAATLLAATVAHPDADPGAHLDDRRPLVAGAAALGLCLRPGDARAADALVELLARPGKSNLRWLRALRIAALGRVPRTKAIRDRLLEAARAEEKAPRRAALLALAEPPLADPAGLLRILDRMKNGDPARGALLFALARTGAPAAIARVSRVARDAEDPGRRAAGAALLYHVCTRRPDDARGIVTSGIREPAALVSKVDATLRGDPDGLARLAREEFHDLGVGFAFGRERRVFDLLEGFLLVLFELDDLEDFGEATRRDTGGDAIGLNGGDDGGGAGPGGGRGGAGAAARAPAEADLIDFLRGERYFGPEHVRAR